MLANILEVEFVLFNHIQGDVTWLRTQIKKPTQHNLAKNHNKIQATQVIQTETPINLTNQKDNQFHLILC